MHELLAACAAAPRRVDIGPDRGSSCGPLRVKKVRRLIPRRVDRANGKMTGYLVEPLCYG